jgi:tetratricopeptide repeat protein 21B
MFGIAKTKEALNMFTPALDSINRLLVSNPNYTCGIIEKLKLQLSTNDWDQCLEVAHRALSVDPNCVEAIRYQILELLCREGRYNDVGLNYLNC